MKNAEEQIQNLIHLKRYETPRAGYFEDFLEEFQSRQRQELLNNSSMSIFAERVGTWFRELGSIKWVAGTGAAYAALMLGVFLWLPSSGPESNPNVQPASYYKPNASEPIPEVDFENGKYFRSRPKNQREF